MSEVLQSTFIDLIKQSLPLYINTGNATLNYSIIGFFIAFINYFFYVFSKSKLFENIKYSFIKSAIVINKTNEEYFLNKINCIPLMSGVWNKNSSLEYKLKYFLTKFFQYKITDYILQIDKEVIVPSTSDLLSFAKFIDEGKCFPLFYSRNGILGISKNKTHVFLVYQNNTIYNEFIDFIDDYPVPQKLETEKVLYNQVEYHTTNPLQVKYKLYPDRTLDNTVTKYKGLIVEYLNAFKEAEETGMSRFNGFGSYNLGIMLYGIPGCGKTTIIRDVANYLNRTAKTRDF